MRKRVHILVLAALICAGPRLVEAHAYLDRASPRVGNTVTPAPREVVLWFTEKLEPAFSSIEVRNEQGASVTASKPTVVGNRTQMRVSLKSLPPGIQGLLARIIRRHASHRGQFHLSRRTIALRTRALTDGRPVDLGTRCTFCRNVGRKSIR